MMYNAIMHAFDSLVKRGSRATSPESPQTGSARTRLAVKSQLQAMNSVLYEVGLFRPAGGDKQAGMLLRTWDPQTLLDSLSWLRWQNSQGRNIFIRPAGEHHLSLIDDLTTIAVRRMKEDGFTPAVIIETSPGNLQAWVNHGEVLPRELSTRAARALAQRFGADRGAADWRHFGRLSGFANRKPKHQRANGLFPFVHLLEARGTIYPAAQEFLGSLRRELAREVEERARLSQEFQSGSRKSDPGPRFTIEDFRRNPKYDGDGNRIDLAYAIYALSHDVTEADIRAAIASRDLTKKGSERRQQDYMDRTLEKARAMCHGGIHKRGLAAYAKTLQGIER
jgi:RepB DNA-primase from phage plasmid